MVMDSASPFHEDFSPGGVLPARAELAYLRRGLDQPGGKLPLFDRRGQKVNAATVNGCIAKGWAEHWFANPIKPDWLVCRLTPAGREMVAHHRPASGRHQPPVSMVGPAGFEPATTPL